MGKKNNSFGLPINELEKKDLHGNVLRFISFRSAIIITLIILIGYISTILLLVNQESLRACLNDVFAVITELMIVLCLFYVAKISSVQGRRVQIFWLVTGIALLSYTLGDILWAIIELVLHQKPFLSATSIFYMLFYLLLTLNIFYLPEKPLSRNKNYKLILDTSIIVITLSIILGIFILPYISLDYALNNITVILYLVGDFIFFLALLRILFNEFENFYRLPLLVLGTGILTQVITDNIYIYQFVGGTYDSGGLLNTGWLLTVLFIYWAAVLKANILISNERCMKFELWLRRFNFPPYLPLLTVLIAYIMVIWVNYGKISQRGLYIEAAIGIIILLVICRQILTLNENKNLYLAAKKEIGNRKKSEEALKLSSRYNRSLIEASLDPLVTIGPDGKITDVNSSTEVVTGHPRHEIVGTDFSNYFTEPEKAREGYKRVFQNGLVRDYPLEIQHRNGNSTPVLYNATTYKDYQGNVIGVFAAARDITELKKAEEEIKTSLNEKELLLREIHHRVKNNMQIISSLLRLQSNYIDDNDVIQSFKESEGRIMAMSLVHELIYISDNLSSIQLENYIQRLVRSIVANYDTQRIIFEFNIDDTKLNIETAIPCGLIITELVTNSLKYAFLENKGVISINFTRESENLQLRVSDDGVGLPDHLLHEEPDSLGISLVKMLVDQLEGNLKIDNTHGTVFIISFKELEYTERV